VLTASPRPPLRARLLARMSYWPDWAHRPAQFVVRLLPPPPDHAAQIMSHFRALKGAPLNALQRAAIHRLIADIDWPRS